MGREGQDPQAHDQQLQAQELQDLA